MAASSNDTDRVQSILTELRVSTESLSARLALLSFGDEDKKGLAAISKWFEKERDDLVSALVKDYSDAGDPLLMKAFAAPEQTLTAELISAYLVGMLSYPYDLAYAKRRIALGVAHQRLGVTPDRFTAMMHRWEHNIVSAYCRCESSNACMSILLTIHKVFLFDITLVLESYAHAEHQSVEYLAKHDVLTGLLNHLGIGETVDELLVDCDEMHPISLFFIGLSRFKAINETLGHQVGDAVLREIAERLKSIAVRIERVARLGGDFFVCVVPDVAESETREMGEKILSALNHPFRMDDFSVDVAATVGAVTAVSEKDTFSEMLSRAEMALYHAKVRHRSFELYADKMKRYSVTHLNIGAEIHRAIRDGELVLYFQPKVSLRDTRVMGMEALIRWRHPVRGLVPPGHFIPMAEDSVIIHSLTEWVLNAAFSKAAEWAALGHDWTMSANLSAANLQNKDLPKKVAALLQRHEVEPSRIVLEITESALMADPPRAMNTVRELKELGVRLAIDDFGTGYSSLAYLKDLPVDEVKVDRSFVMGMSADGKDERIVLATVFLGHSLGLSVTAEGVEDEAVFLKLLEMGCDQAQGYYIARPMPEEDFLKWAEHADSLRDSSDGVNG